MPQKYTSKEFFLALDRGGSTALFRNMVEVIMESIQKIPYKDTRYNHTWTPDDLCQETICKLIESSRKKKIKYFGDFSAYARARAFNICRNRWKSRKLRIYRNKDIDPIDLLRSETSDPNKQPDHSLEMAYFRYNVYQYWERTLSDEDYQIAIMRYVWELSYQDIHEMLRRGPKPVELSVDAIKQRVSRMRPPMADDFERMGFV